MEVRELADSERQWAVERLVGSWGSVYVARLGELKDTSVLPTLVAVLDDELVGLLTYEVVGDQAEVVSIDAFVPLAGVGTALLHAAVERARSLGCTRVWLITTNDNLPALRFYQRRGMRIVAVHRDAENAARRLKPSIPVVGHHGIEIHDELELELRL